MDAVTKVSKKAWSISQRYETIVIGDPYSGKSSYLNALVADERSKNLPVMISADQNQFEFWAENKTKKAIFIVRDTANQERFRSLTQSYYRKAQCVLLAFDLNNEESFQNLKKWYEDALNYCESQDTRFAVVLVGIKKKRDPEAAYVPSAGSSSTTVDNHLIEAFVQEHSPIVIDYCQVDLANDANLKEPFNILLDHFSTRKTAESDPRASSIFQDSTRGGAKTDVRQLNSRSSVKDDRRLSLGNPNYGGFNRKQQPKGAKLPKQERIDEEDAGAAAAASKSSGRRSVKRSQQESPEEDLADTSGDEGQPKKCCSVS